MTADSLPLPGEPTAGRHRPERLHPLGVQLDRLLARCGYRFTATHHSHGGTA